MSKNFLKLLLLVCIALLMVVFLYMQYRQKPFNFYGTIIDSNKKIKAFSLDGIDNKKFTNKNLKGEWTYMFFGFSNCPTVCPTTLGELNKVYKILQEKKPNSLPKVVLISIDPERDNSETLARYVSKFNTNFYAAKGSKTEIVSLAKNFGVWFESGPNINHSGTIILISPNEKLKAIYTSPHRASLIAKDFLELSKR